MLSRSRCDSACQIIRLPFGDRCANEPSKAQKIQDFLREQGFQKATFPGVLESDAGIDALYTWNTQDFKSEFIANKDRYLDNFKSQFAKFGNAPQILLLHDFENNHHLFEDALNFLIEKGCEFKSPIS
jgi:hypothetical protein